MEGEDSVRHRRRHRMVGKKVNWRCNGGAALRGTQPRPVNVKCLSPSRCGNMATPFTPICHGQARPRVAGSCQRRQVKSNERASTNESRRQVCIHQRAANVGVCARPARQRVVGRGAVHHATSDSGRRTRHGRNAPEAQQQSK